jgi:dUTP pyrophosphatase
MPRADINRLDGINREKMRSIHNGRQSGAYTVGVYRVDGERGESAVMPEHKTIGSSGADLYAAEDATIPAGKWGLVRTGLIFECPNIRWEVQIRSRSGLALKHGVFVLNSPGTIDADYRGEVGIILANMGDAAFVVKKGDRIAQAVISKLQAIVFEEQEGAPDETVRGAGGFGSTGV